MKKVAALVLSVLLLTGVLVACTGSGGGSGSNGSGDAGTKLSLGIWDPKQQPALEEIIKTYTEQNPNVTIEIQLTPYKGGEYWTKLEAGMTGGNAPDVFWINALHVESYVEGGMLLPLDDAITENGLSMSEFPEALVNMYTVGGRTVCSA